MKKNLSGFNLPTVQVRENLGIPCRGVHDGHHVLGREGASAGHGDGNAVGGGHRGSGRDLGRLVDRHVI